MLQWEYVYGAVEVVAGETQFQFMPTVSLDLSGGFLTQIAQSDPAAEHVVIWDAQSEMAGNSWLSNLPHIIGSGPDT